MVLDGCSVVGYVRVSTSDQDENGVGLEAQKQAIRAECKHRGWKLVAIHEDTASGSSTNGRPGLAAAIASRLGRPRRTPDAILDRIRMQRDNGSTWQAIADRLNAERFPTTRGGNAWQVGTVQGAYRTARLDRLAEGRKRLLADTAALVADYPDLEPAIRRVSSARMHAIRAAEVAHEPITDALLQELGRDPLLKLAFDEAQERRQYPSGA